MASSDELRKRIREKVGEQRLLVRTLLAQREQLQGSLFARWGECGKETCACRQGRKHGPYYVLSLRRAGKGAFEYLDKSRLKRARALVLRYKSFQKGMRRLKVVNGEIVVLLRRYQSQMAKRAGRELRGASVGSGNP